MGFKNLTKDLPIGKRLEYVRILKDMTQQQVASKLAMSKQGYSKLEQSNFISDRRLAQIAQVFHVTVEGLKSFNEQDLYKFKPGIVKTVQVQKSENPFIQMFDLSEKIRIGQAELIKVEREKVELLKHMALVMGVSQRNNKHN